MLRRFDGVSLRKLIVRKYTEKELLLSRDHGIQGKKRAMWTICS